MSRRFYIQRGGREPRCNPRFAVTTLREALAAVYAVYCQRDAELL
ncbi:MAG: hypothetical protein P0119_16425 [Nitrospira sp.]|nr:hypothetical protein [Nitrospira sp.]